MKKITAVLLASALLLGLGACSSPHENTKTAISVVAAQYSPQSAYWWHCFEKDFEAANPNVDLIVDVVAWENIRTVVDNRLTAGEAPDIVNIDVFADYQARGLLLSTDAFASQEVRDKMLPVYWEQSRLDDRVWALPAVASARALYYNKDLLAQAGVEVPQTWSELEQAAGAIRDRCPGEIYPWGVDMTVNEGHACFAYYAWNNGGGFLDEDGNWALNREENAEALDFVIGLVNSGLTNPDPATDSREYLQELFASGKLAMMIGPNQIASFVSAYDTPISFGVAPIPANDGREAAACGVMDRFLCFDNRYSRAELDAIHKFFDLFYEDSRYADWVLMEDLLPVTDSGAALVCAASPARTQWVELADDSLFAPVSKPEWAAVKSRIIDLEQKALLGAETAPLLDALQVSLGGT